MKRFSFSKYHGAGNDFVLFDNRDGSFPTHQRDCIQNLCDRNRGVGADGLILVEPSSAADFRMRIFNRDGSEAEMCGNGLRCFKRFLGSLGHHAQTTQVEAGGKLLTVTTDGEGVAINLHPPSIIQWGCSFKAAGQTLHGDWLDTGVPHLVLFVSDVDKIDVPGLGAKIRLHPLFQPKGVNVNFVQVASPGFLKIRTFERGVEAETLACGTGAAAAAIGHANRQNLDTNTIQVQVRSGDRLNIRYERLNGLFTAIQLSGPATEIFRGEILI